MVLSDLNMDYVQKYARLIIELGVNIQKGQKLFIRSSVDNASFVELLSEMAWQKGAADVWVQWSNERTLKQRFTHGDTSIFGVEKQWQVEFFNEIVNQGYQLLTLSSHDPENLKGIDPLKTRLESSMLAEIGKGFTEQTMSHKVQWNVVALPSIPWARKVFPHIVDPYEAVLQLWDILFKASFIDHNDPVENWNNHLHHLNARKKKLQDYNFSSLHFTNSWGTDLTIGLPKGHIWTTCHVKAKTGYDFVFNLPTYEVFTAPHRKAVNGIVYNTKPIFSKGNIIHDFWIKFEDGQVGDYKAEIGHDFLKEIITQHINGDYLGEVALVPHSSPISNFGFPLYHNLLDENASCHLALGQGYTTNLVDSDDLTEAERLTKGLNQCLSHTDFMIGSSCMNITGKTHDGQDVQVFTNGEWAI